MKVLVLSCLMCAAGVLAAPVDQQQQREPVAIVKYENDASVDGTFHTSFESADGTAVQQDGRLKDVTGEDGKPAKAEELTGSVHYQGDDGQSYDLTYIADENGYQPQGAHLPTPPPIPAAIQRSLDYIATAKPQVSK